MKPTDIKTFGALKAAGYQSKGIKEELRNNLIQLKKEKQATFTGVHGYENSVIPQLERALLSKHNINLLGLRGQAKTRLARQMVHLLDEYVPVVAGSEINDDPFAPISRYAQELIAEKGDETPITWLHRSERFAEKLATPDVTVADIIGDVDPIKAANLKLSYADDRVIHYGMIPRANRCIFVINELPDLQARIQVALFNILQEGDIQIRGFKLRFNLDMQFVFTANPEDYTNRGSIITPLKDRIGSQILTHYPSNIQIAKTITQQEAKLENAQKDPIYVPELAKDLIEQIGFEARQSEFVDVKSGVSARLSISAYENLISSAELRMLTTEESETTVRLSDFMGIIPAINGKIELVYEGEQEGAANVAENLLRAAIKTLFASYFPTIEKLTRKSEVTPYDAIVQWFLEGSSFELPNDLTNQEYQQQLDYIAPLTDLIRTYQPDLDSKDHHFFKEFILWALVEHKKLSKVDLEEGFGFKDSFESFIDGI
ncbi:magnesium chelatase [Ochrovirga pacifica]|uniref:magnesium chelatase n=1 Tax=Ochrovirga pacifica TaxID=1042376 RepID=UPI0002558B44|nr:magnesium chelatase [Ochrovirga pacifica]